MSSTDVSRKMTNEHSDSYANAMKDVQQLISEGNVEVNSKLMNKLRSKYNNNELIDMIVEGLSERVATIKSRAHKFAKAVIKHSGQNTPLHTLLRRALKYKEKLGLTDPEFEYFKAVLHTSLNGQEEYTKTNGLLAINTNLSRALGNIDIETNEGIRAEQADYPFLQEIIKLASVHKPLHASVIIQQMLYEEYGLEALTGTYEPSKHNIACHIHPVIAAMFLPKIKIFADTFLYANIAHIVKARYEKNSVMTMPDYVLLYSMISDPNDVVCDIDSPFKDLRNRVLLQESLWQSVLALRSGRYYDCTANQFLSAIDNCKLSNADAPDVIYLGDEATIVRRLLQAFSLRPIVVSSMPIYGVISSNVANFPVNMNRVTAIPMISVRLPISYNQGQVQSFDLLDSLNTPQYHLENNSLVPKMQQIIYNRGVVIFHVGRRTSNPTYSTMLEPRNWQNLFPTVSAYEKCNMLNVNVPLEMNGGISLNSSGDNNLVFKSAVSLLTHPHVTGLIIGSCAVLRHEPSESNQWSDRYYLYNPAMAHLKADTGASIEQNAPVSALAYSDEYQYRSFIDLVQKYGTVLIYASKTSDVVSANQRGFY